MLAQETQLVERLKAGNSDAFAELYDRYSPALLGICLKIVGNSSDAENVLQDTFVKIWRNIAHYDASKGRLFTWLLAVARNTALDFVRSAYFSAKKEIQNIDTAVSIGFSPPELEKLDHLGLNEVLDQLEPKLRVIVDHLYFLGYSQQELADELQMPLGTVKTRTRMALAQLREKLST